MWQPTELERCLSVWTYSFRVDIVRQLVGGVRLPTRLAAGPDITFASLARCGRLGLGRRSRAVAPPALVTELEEVSFGRAGERE
jgi:hypothetical protein